MSENFTRENPALSAKLAAAKSPDELRDILLAYQQANGLPNATDRVALPSRTSDAPSPSQPEAAKDDGTQLFRRAVTLDNGTIRLIEAYSVGGLDVLESALRGKRI